MRAEGRYYWIKMKTNFFNTPPIQILWGLPNGFRIICIYERLLCHCVDANGDLYSSFYDDLIKELSTVYGIEEHDMQEAVETLGKLQLLKRIKTDRGEDCIHIDLTDWVGSETHEAAKKRKQRQAKKARENLEKDNVPTMSRQCPRDIEIEKYIE